MNVLKTNKCPSLSGKSRLTYNIGTDDGGAVHLRVQANSGGGFFSQEWVAVETVDKTLSAVRGGITAVHLVPLFQGKSVNTPAFLLAVLRQEKLLMPMAGKPRRYVWQDSRKFLATLEQPTPKRPAKPPR